MKKQTEALKIAIEALETCTEYSGYEYWFDGDVVRNALKIAREALEQPAQEPVAYELWQYGRPYQLVKRADVVDEMAYKARLDGAENVEVTPLYTHPAPSWQGLSQEEQWNLINRSDIPADYDHEILAIARAIEQALKEKNG